MSTPITRLTKAAEALLLEQPGLQALVDDMVTPCCEAVESLLDDRAILQEYA